MIYSCDMGIKKDSIDKIVLSFGLQEFFYRDFFAATTYIDSSREME